MILLVYLLVTLQKIICMYIFLFYLLLIIITAYIQTLERGRKNRGEQCYYSLMEYSIAQVIILSYPYS